MSRLGAKVAFISGGGSGIGRAVVEAYVAAGASVCVLERDPRKCAALAPRGNDRVHAIAGDATSPADNERAVTEAVERYGGLDIAATFVGRFDNYTPLVEIPAERLDAAIDEIFAVNVKSVLYAARAAAPELARRRGSLIVTCSSSSYYPGRGGTLYVASKFALRGIVVELGRELAPEVRVNGVAPGGTVDTDLRGLASLGHADHHLQDRPDREAALRRRTPLGVALRPRDHAAAYVYLASDGARGVSGEILRSDGGLGLR